MPTALRWIGATGAACLVFLGLGTSHAGEAGLDFDAEVRRVSRVLTSDDLAARYAIVVGLKRSRDATTAWRVLYPFLASLAREVDAAYEAYRAHGAVMHERASDLSRRGELRAPHRASGLHEEYELLLATKGCPRRRTPGARGPAGSLSGRPRRTRRSARFDAHRLRHADDRRIRHGGDGRVSTRASRAARGAAACRSPGSMAHPATDGRGQGSPARATRVAPRALARGTHARW